MPLLHAIGHGIKPVLSSVPHELNLTPTPAEHVLDTQVIVDNLAPRDGQPVFERTLPSRTTKSRRVVITALLILANVVQVLSYSLNFFAIIANLPILTTVDDS
jgi:hypothetical protein